MAIFKNCCCCISLRNGGVILGVISAFATLFAMYDELRSIFANPASPQDSTPGSAWSDRIFVTIYLLMCVTVIVTALMLIYGSIKRRKSFLIPYLATDAARCLFLAFILQKKISLAFDTPSDMRGDLVISIWTIAFSIALQVYLWICVYSLFQAYREEKLRLPSAAIYEKQPAYNPHIVYSQLTKV